MQNTNESLCTQWSENLCYKTMQFIFLLDWGNLFYIFLYSTSSLILHSSIFPLFLTVFLLFQFPWVSSVNPMQSPNTLTICRPHAFCLFLFDCVFMSVLPLSLGLKDLYLILQLLFVMDDETPPLPSNSICMHSHIHKSLLLG